MPLPSVGNVYIENRGQWDSDVLFLAQTPGLDVWITSTGVVYDAFALKPGDDRLAVRRQGDVVRMEFLQASTRTSSMGRTPIQTQYSYLTTAGRFTEVKLFGEAVVQNMYDGVDVVYYFDGGRVRYDCIVQPGARPSQIALAFRGADSVHVADDGTLVFTTVHGSVSHQGLVAYQMAGDEKRRVPCSFVVVDSFPHPVVSFDVGVYDPALPLVIDPLVYTSFLGGTGVDELVDIAVDRGGNTFVVGTTLSPDFPKTTGAYDTVWSNRDVVVTKLDYSGTGITFSTFLGGDNEERAYGLARDRNGYLYVTGETRSTQLPGLKYTYPSLHPEGSNVFVACLNSSGTDILYLTLIGSPEDDTPGAIAADDMGNVYVTGTTRSAEFPTYHLPYGPNRGGREAFLFSLNSLGAWRYSTLLSGTDDDGGTAIAVDPGGAYFWLTGVTKSKDLPTTDGTVYQGTGASHIFFARYRTTGEKLLLGYVGTGTAQATSIVVDGQGAAYLAGYTPDGSFSLPVSAIQPQYDKTAGGAEGLLLKISTSGTVVYSTFLGGSYHDVITGIEVDAAGNVIMVGSTTQEGAVDDFLPISDQVRNSRREGFVAVLYPGEARLSYATYLGGNDSDECTAVAVARDSTVYVVGNTRSQDLPVSLGSPEYRGNQDGMVARAQYIPKLRLPDDGRVLDFGVIYVGETVDKDVLFSNYGLSSVAIERMVLKRGTVFTSPFVTPAIVPTGVPTGELPVQFTFSPTQVGVFRDTVEFTVRFLKTPFTVFLKGEARTKPLPVVALTPDTLDLGPVYVGESTSGVLALLNTGVVSAAIENIAVEGTAEFVHTGATTAVLAVAAGMDVPVTFSPVAVGKTSATVAVYVERLSTTLTAVVRGEGVDRPRPIVYTESDSVDFRLVQVGRSRQQVVIVHNTGTTTATLLAETVSGPFTSTLATLLLERNSSVPLTVGFAPSAPGEVSGQIRLTVQELDEPLLIGVHGEGVLPAAVVQPRDTVDFGDVTIGSTAKDRITVRNIGIDSLRIAALGAVGGGFARHAVAPANLDVDEELVVDVEFTPPTVGMYSTTCTVVVDYLPDPVLFVLRGSGVEGHVEPQGIAIFPDTLDFGTVTLQSSKDLGIVVTNRSTTQSIRIEDIAIVQGGRRDFVATSASVPPYDIAAGGRDTLRVVFTPESEGVATAFVRISSTVNTLTVALLGTGAPVPPPDTVVVALSDINARIGALTDVVLTVEDAVRARDILQRTGVTAFRAVLRWNASMMVPVEGQAPGNVQGGIREVVITGPIGTTGDTLYRIPVRILLGDAEYCGIRLAELTLLPEADRTAYVYLDRTDTARLHITDIWRDGDGPRLINPYAGPLELRISPNPFTDGADIVVGHAAPGASLKLYNLVGECVADISSRLSPGDSATVALDRTMLPGAGVYYCRLVSGAYTIVRTVVLLSGQ